MTFVKLDLLGLTGKLNSDITIVQRRRRHYFIQQMPIYQTPYQGQKWDSSPLFGSNPDNNGKRSRQLSAAEDLFDVSPSMALSDSCTIQDVMKELKKLATKEDIVQIKGTMVA